MTEPSFQAGVKRCPSPIIFCDCEGPCSQYPDRPPLRKRERVVTHSPMFKLNKERLRDMALIIVIGAGALLYTYHKDEEAVGKGDFYACHTDDCREQVRLDQLNIINN